MVLCRDVQWKLSFDDVLTMEKTCSMKCNKAFEAAKDSVARHLQSLLQQQNSKNRHESKDSYVAILRSEYDDTVATENHLNESISVRKREISVVEATLTSLQEKRQTFVMDTKELHQALISAKKHYDNGLNIYYTIDSATADESVIAVCFLTKHVKNLSEQQYVLKLSRNRDTLKNKLLDMTPKPPAFKALQQKLQESNDVMGLLCYARKYFKASKSGHVPQKKR